MQNKHFFFYILSLISFSNCFAQVTNSRFTSYTLEDGISSVFVNDIVQDTTGYMWFATAFGLNKFDGYRFTTYKNIKGDSTSINNDYIRALYLDTKGNLWAGHSKGLSLYNPEKDNFSNYLDGVYVRNIQEDKSGNLWLATNQGVVRFNSKTKFYQHQEGNSQSLPTNNVLCVLEDSQGMIWIGTSRKGLCMLNPKNDSIYTYSSIENDKSSLSDNNVLSLFEDTQQQLWIGTVNGLNKFNRNSGQFIRYTSKEYPIQSNVIFDICQDKEGSIWFGSYGGLNKIDSTQTEFTNIQHIDTDPNSLADNQIRSLLLTKENLLWVGTFNGLSSLDLFTSSFHHIKHIPNNKKSLSANFVWSIFKDSKDNVWVGTKDGGLNLMNEKLERIQTFQHNPNNSISLSNNDVYSTYEDKKGQFWVTTDGGGFNLFNSTNETFFNFRHDTNDTTSLSNDFVKKIIEDDKGIYWIGTIRGGLNQYNPITKTFKRFKPIKGDTTSLSDIRIYDILQDEKGRLWIATNNGLNLFNYGTETFTRYVHAENQPSSLSNNTVFSITEDQESKLWLGTRGGLNMFNPETGIFKVYNQESGLPDNTVYAALEDGHHNFWLSTNKGICKFNPEEETVISYDQEDGLQGNEFNTGAYFKDKQGVMYFGGVNGLNFFHPDSITEYTTPPPVVLSDFLIFNKSVSVSDSSVLSQPIDHTKSITLNYDDYIFAFEFSALNFRQASKNKYAYKLTPFNNEWIETNAKDRKAVFTNVPHGTYQFHVKASNDNGYWNDEGTTVQIIILPPWWLTWWMKSIYWILGIGLPLGFYFIRVNTLKKRQIVLAETVRQRTSELKLSNEELRATLEIVSQQKEEIEAQTNELKLTNEKLIELDKYKEGVTHMIIHDLKNPLNAIINPSTYEHEKSITRVQQAGRQMLNMVMNILDVHKYEETKLIIEKANHNLNDIVKYSIEEVFFLAEQKSIKIQNQTPKTLTVQTDKALLSRVFINLFTNAIKYTPINGAITIITESISEKNIKVSVIDKGQGIPDNQLDKIFDKFGQVQAKDSGKVGSTGLGLTFCKLVIEAHEQKIGVESVEGKGTTVWFTLENISTKNLQLNDTYEEIISTPKIVLSKEDKVILQPVIEQLKNLMVYESSAIEAVLSKIETNGNVTLNLWKQEVESSLQLMNEEKYKELINL